jgi:transposase
MRSKGSAEQLQERRLKAIALLKQGHTQVEVARRLGVTPSAVSQWNKTYDQEGRDALLAKYHAGPAPKLSLKQCERLLKYLRQGPRKHGWLTELWTLPRIAELIDRKFDVQYNQSGVWRLLNRLGWSCQKPERRARERDAVAIARWRQHDWPRLKKRAA